MTTTPVRCPAFTPSHCRRLAKFLVPAILFILSLSAQVITSHAEDWPEFLGPTANGTSTETNLINSFPADGPPIVWEKDIGTGYSAPSIREGKLVLHHRLKNEEIVEAFNVTDGKPIWRYAYPTSFVDPYGYNNGPRCTPLLTSNRCYTFGAEGVLLCLDMATGKPTWHRDTQKQWEIPEAFFGVGSTPILEGNRLIVMIGGQPNSGVAALDPATGKTIWESVGETNWQGQPMIGWPGERTVDWKRYRHDKQASYATPVAATVHGQRQLFCLMRQGLVALNPTNGAVNFSYWFRAQVDESVNAANPVVVDNHVFISTAYYRVGSALLQILPDNKSFESVWRNTNLEIHWTTPIYHEGYLYAFSGRNEPDARFRCVEYKTGRIMWDRDERWRRYGQTLGTYGRGSAILAEGKLIVLGEAGLLGLFRLNPNRDEELARYQLPQLKYPCWAAPVLSNRRVYLRSENKLLCLDFAKK
jgi:outer membrane protein assembly factor BamB